MLFTDVIWLPYKILKDVFSDGTEYKVCSNDDPGLTLTYITATSTLPPNAFVLENAKIIVFKETIEVFE